MGDAVWTPDSGVIERANVTQFAASRGLKDYAELWAWSTQDRVGFWEAVVERLGIVFDTPYVPVSYTHPPLPTILRR